MKILVCGGRHYSDYTELANTLWNLEEKRGKITEIIHGGATGADELARQFSSYCKIPSKVFAAKWGKYGNAAGPIRNKQMIDEAKPDLVLAFPGGIGTEDMKRQARKAGIEVIEVKENTYEI